MQQEADLAFSIESYTFLSFVHHTNHFDPIAEAALRELEVQPGFSLALLQLVASTSVDQTLRLASALFFKNFIKRRWTVREV